MKTVMTAKQIEQKRNWETYLTQRNVLIIATNWAVGNCLLVLSATDLLAKV